MSENKVVVISGITGGLGIEIAKTLASKGYSIAGLFLTNDGAIESLRKIFFDFQIKFKFYKVDLLVESEIISSINNILLDFNKIDVLLNIAGISFSGMSWKQSSNDWENVFKINTKAPFLLSKEVIPSMKQQGFGRIIYFSSVVAHHPQIGTSAYSASKAALEGLTKAQALELAKSGITVNCIAPGYFNAGMISTVDEKVIAELKKNIPIGRLGNPSEISESILYLLSENSGYITGQTLHINGGLYF